jgi:DNA-binding NarL/FixJ family response regulator
MPGMQGPELAERLAAARPRLRCLFVSGFTENALVHHGVVGAPGAYLAKPFSAESLARAVRDALSGDP